jgi:hypothetical protein
MRTTLTLDDALLRELRALAHKNEAPFKDVVDKVLRAGLDNLKVAQRPRRYRARTFAMGRPSTPRMDKALEIATELENEEIARKIALRK